MAVILRARHGQNVANLTATFSHRTFDGDLTSTGRQQAEALAGHLAAISGTPVRALICSPLRRARQTAQIIASRLGLPAACELLRAALPGLTGQPDPGTDTPPGTAATLHVDTRGPALAIRLLSWPQESA